MAAIVSEPDLGKRIPPRRITTCLVLQERGWILEKLATRLADHLAAWNVEAQISYSPSSQADVNHWVHYLYLDGGMYAKNTMSITHVDRSAKLHILKQRMKKADMGICMSRMTLEQLVLSGIPREKLCYITPAHDGEVVPRRIVIGITSQIRRDGAKREDVLIKMAQTIRLDAFQFEIVGPNWENVIPYFQAAGATVNYNSGMYLGSNEEHLRLVYERLKRFDYYLYMGWDEGSMGFLDALAAGIPTIVTPQGFHLDINGGITHSFANAQDLCAIFSKIAKNRQIRIDSVSRLTWNEYARQHALVWRALVTEQQQGINELLHSEDVYSNPLPNLSGYKIGSIGPNLKAKFNSDALKNDMAFLFEFYTNRKFQNTLLSVFIKRLKYIFKL
jgi:hypothetical protein